MGLAERLEQKAIDNFYDRLKEGVIAANPAAKAHAPAMRDLKEQTRVWIGSDSDNNKAYVFFKCDSKDPDVAKKNKSTTYANGVDLANITNGGPNSKRKLATHGWWKRAVDAGIKEIRAVT